MGLQNKHDLADERIRALCDRVSSILLPTIAGLQKSAAREWCVLSVGGTALCQIYHQRSRIVVWPRWSPQDIAEFESLVSAAGLSCVIRRGFDNSWAKRWPARIFIANENDLRGLPSIIATAANKLRPGGTQVDAAVEYDAQELLAPETYPEGGRRTVIVNAYERSAGARAACINFSGAICVVCGIDFATMYGALGQGFIHVHHIVPIASVANDYEVDPVKDLRPVCPNCHEMLHRRQPPLAIDELKRIMQQAEEA